MNSAAICSSWRLGSWVVPRVFLNFNTSRTSKRLSLLHTCCVCLLSLKRAFVLRQLSHTGHSLHTIQSINFITQWQCRQAQLIVCPRLHKHTPSSKLWPAAPQTFIHTFRHYTCCHHQCCCCHCHEHTSAIIPCLLQCAICHNIFTHS